MATKQFPSQLPNLIPKAGTKKNSTSLNTSSPTTPPKEPKNQLLPVSKIKLFSPTHANLQPKRKKIKKPNFRICIPGQHTISNHEDTNDTLGPVLWQKRGRYGGTGPGVNK